MHKPDYILTSYDIHNGAVNSCIQPTHVSVITFSSEFSAVKVAIALLNSSASLSAISGLSTQGTISAVDNELLSKIYMHLFNTE